MNIKKGRATRKRCARKCKKRTSRKLRGSRRYGGGMKDNIMYTSPSATRTRYVKSINPNNPVRSTISKRPDIDVYGKRMLEARRRLMADLIQKDNAVLYKQPLVNDTPPPPPPPNNYPQS
jgi:hypothetical protein